MTDQATLMDMLKRVHGNIEQLDIFDGDTEISLPITDMLSMHHVHVKFRFDVDGALKWIDVEVR
jgi:hypothetical protein